MQPVNTPDNPRILSLLEMVRALSHADSPIGVMTAFATGYWALNPLDYMISLSLVNVPEDSYRITRQINVSDVLSGRDELLPPSTWENRDRLPIASGGFLGWVVRQQRPLLIHNLSVRNDPALGDTIAHVGSVMCLPLYDRGEIRYWNFQFRRSPEGFSLKDLEQALLTSNLVGGTNNRLLLVEEVKRLNTALRAQFEDVARVQQALLPRQLPDIPGLEIATSYLTSEQAGGDYYDFFPFANGRWGILIADVSGHGAAAATIMAMLHGILHAYTDDGKTPDGVLRYANRRLLDAGIEGNFVTAFFAIYEPKGGRLVYARSGHNPPLLKSGRTGSLRHLDGEGAPPLGVLEPYEIVSESLQLETNDTVILYTDGITEAFNAQREMFGSARLDAALTGCSGSPDCVVDSVHTALYQHTGSRSRADDQTLVALRYVGR